MCGKILVFCSYWGNCPDVTGLFYACRNTHRWNIQTQIVLKSEVKAEGHTSCPENSSFKRCISTVGK